MTTIGSDKEHSLESKNQKIFVVDKYVCNFIKSEWMKPGQSSRSFAKNHGVHEAVARKIKRDNGYQIPVSSLTAICFNRGVKLSKFFELLESKYGDKINDDFIER